MATGGDNLGLPFRNQLVGRRHFLALQMFQGRPTALRDALAKRRQDFVRGFYRLSSFLGLISPTIQLVCARKPKTENVFRYA